jgi:peptidoglycan biosynthesis protein MviN/MurJ (putative lipid II flippase)
MGQALLAASFNLIANLVLVPRFGYVAAAYNTLAAYVLLVGLAWWQSRPYMRLNLPWSELARIGAASVVMGIAVWLPFARAMSTASRPTSALILGAQVVLGVAIYIALLLVFRAVRRDEIRFLSQLGRSGFSRLRK